MRTTLLLFGSAAAHLLESEETLWEDHLPDGLFVLFFLLVLAGIVFCGLYYCMHHRDHGYHRSYAVTPPYNPDSSSSDDNIPHLEPSDTMHATAEVHRVYKTRV